MKKEILIFGIICLFIGVGIQPAIANVNNSSISNDGNDCEICQKVEPLQLLKIKSLLFSLETHFNELSFLSKQNPIIKTIYQEFSKTFSVLKEINMDYMSYWDFPIICPILFILQTSLILLEFYYWYFGGRFDLPLVNGIIEILDSLGLLLNCSWYDPPPLH